MLSNYPNFYFCVPTRNRDSTRLVKDLKFYAQNIIDDITLTKLAVVDIFPGLGSIFDFFNAVKNLTANSHLDDIVIFCHDDIEIHTQPYLFRDILTKTLKNRNVGFAGVAGTTELGENAVWWDKQRWIEQKHSGFVFHGSELQATYFGPHREVVVLDGLFLATTVRVLKELDLNKPSYFTGNWDFYDIYYCLKVRELGYKNFTVPITIMHKSRGELAGRTSWEQNRIALINNFTLPIKV